MMMVLLLCVPHLGIPTPWSLKKFIMTALLYYLASIQHHDVICVLNGAQPMGNHQHGAVGTNVLPIS